MRTPAFRIALLIGVAAVATFRCWGGPLLPPETPEPVRSVRWVSTHAVAGVAADGDRIHLATRGALMILREGQPPERVWAPEAEWRGVTPHAAVGVTAFARWTGDGWQVRSLPAGTESYCVAETVGGTWVGHSRGASYYTSNGGEVQLPDDIGPVRALVSMDAGTWCLGEKEWVLASTAGAASARVTPPAGLVGPWQACAWQDRLCVSGSGEDGAVRLATLNGSRWKVLPTLPDAVIGRAAIAADGVDLLLAAPGSGLWRWRGAWTRVAAPPPNAEDFSSVAASPHGVLVGTWAHGAWCWRDGRWTRLAAGGELPAGNVQSLAEWSGALWLATFDQGLWRKDGHGWKRFGKSDGLSSDAPRSLGSADGRLLVRHAGGEIDSFDGRTWSRDVLKWKVPRAWAASLTPQGLLGGWGTIARLDSGGWSQELLPEPLHAETITATAAVPDGWLVGTAKSGVWRVTGSHAVPLAGMADAWTTALAERDGAVLAGTFSGEVAFWPSGPGKSPAPITAKLPSSVTAACLSPGRSPLVACRSGLWSLTHSEWRKVNAKELVGLEPQCLTPGKAGVWVGGRNGIAFVKWPE